MKIHRRIAVTWNEPDLFAERQRLRLRPEHRLAVLVRHICEMNVLAAVHPRRSLFATIGFEPGVNDGAFGRGSADDRGENEQTMLERRVESAILVANPGVIGVHEDI